MIRLHAIVEGRTEERFVKEFLAPYLAGFNIFADVCRVETSRSRKREDTIFKGGVTTYKHLKCDINKRILSDNNSDCRYTIMVDFYRLPSDFPGYDTINDHMDKYEQVSVLEDALRKDINDPRFIPYIQLHEFEALLFVEPQHLGKLYFDREEEIKKLTEMSKGQNPELINNGRETAPSKRIINLIPEHKDNKPDGAWIVSQTSIHKLKENCRHFREWVKSLESLCNNRC